MIARPERTVADGDLHADHDRVLLSDQIHVQSSVSGLCHAQDLSDVVGAHVLSGHHAFESGAVLDAVQGSALRSDPAHAGPADLDGVCAQLVNWALT